VAACPTHRYEKQKEKKSTKKNHFFFLWVFLVSTKFGSQGILCCAPPASNNNNNNNNNNAGVDMGSCTSPQGRSGTCRRTNQCGMTSFPSRTGARGCEDIPAADVQCCAPASPGGGTVSGGSGPVQPAGQCQLARPDSSCSAFNGRTMTINVRFIDEIQRVHAHARASGATVTITDSYRSPTVGYGAGQSRHKVGFAIDMNSNGCNSDCMCRVPTRVAAVTTFLRRLMADPNLHWGGDPSKPINWRVGSCSRDSVHIQSTRYEAGSNYGSEQSCLAREYSAGRFRTFSCPQIAALNDEIDFANLENYNADDATEGLSAGEQAGIAVGVIIAIALLCALIVFCVIRRNTRSDEVVANKFYKAEQDGNTGGSENFGSGAQVYSSSAPGQYACADCGKTYAAADDLVTHRNLRH
jgi:hypothetical protein